MGFEESGLLTDSDADSGMKDLSVSCSICLDAVTDNGDRSWAKLQCGHQFHLDCIGSAFNMRGAMQCPNCRKIEQGQWLYASGSRPLPEFSMDDWAHDEDLYDLNHSEMSFGVHWCPFGGLTRPPSSFDDAEFSSNSYHDLPGQHALSSATTGHPCPYIAYLGPIHPSSSNSGGSVLDGSSFHSHWNGPSVSSEMSPTTYAFPAMDVHDHRWEHHSSPFTTSSSRGSGGDQTSIPSAAQRAARTSSDIARSRSFMHPFLVAPSSAARGGSPIASSMMPPYPGSVARARDRVQALQAYFQQPSNLPSMRTSQVISNTRRSSSHRGTVQVGPTASSSDQTSGGGFYFFPPASSGRNFQEVENPVSNHFQPWEREHLTSFSSSHQLDRDRVWGPFHQGAAGGSDSGIRSSGFRQSQGYFESPPPQNQS